MLTVPCHLLSCCVQPEVLPSLVMYQMGTALYRIEEHPRVDEAFDFRCKHQLASMQHFLRTWTTYVYLTADGGPSDLLQLLEGEPEQLTEYITSMWPSEEGWQHLREVAEDVLCAAETFLQQCPDSNTSDQVQLALDKAMWKAGVESSVDKEPSFLEDPNDDDHSTVSTLVTHIVAELLGEDGLVPEGPSPFTGALKGVGALGPPITVGQLKERVLKARKALEDGADNMEYNLEHRAWAFRRIVSNSMQLLLYPAEGQAQVKQLPGPRDTVPTSAPNGDRWYWQHGRSFMADYHWVPNLSRLGGWQGFFREYRRCLFDAPRAAGGAGAGGDAGAGAGAGGDAGAGAGGDAAAAAAAAGAAAGAGGQQGQPAPELQERLTQQWCRSSGMFFPTTMEAFVQVSFAASVHVSLVASAYTCSSVAEHDVLGEDAFSTPIVLCCCTRHVQQAAQILPRHLSAVPNQDCVPTSEPATLYKDLQIAKPSPRCCAVLCCRG
jgi:hypothetical protein